MCSFKDMIINNRFITRDEVSLKLVGGSHHDKSVFIYDILNSNTDLLGN